MVVTTVCFTLDFNQPRKPPGVFILAVVRGGIKTLACEVGFQFDFEC